MNIKFIIAAAVLSFLTAPLSLFAQHCPFDGGSMIVVHIVDAKGDPVIIGDGPYLQLQEVENGDAGKCSFNDGLVNRTFERPAQAFLVRYKNQGPESFSTFCKDCAYNAPGYYSVIMGMSEQSCMIKSTEGNGYEKYVPRKYEIRFTGSGPTQTVTVQPDQIHSMCLGVGKWSRIKPIEIRAFSIAPNSFESSIFLNF